MTRGTEIENVFKTFVTDFMFRSEATKALRGAAYQHKITLTAAELERFVIVLGDIAPGAVATCVGNPCIPSVLPDPLPSAGTPERELLLGAVFDTLIRDRQLLDSADRAFAWAESMTPATPSSGGLVPAAISQLTVQEKHKFSIALIRKGDGIIHTCVLPGCTDAQAGG